MVNFSSVQIAASYFGVYGVMTGIYPGISGVRFTNQGVPGVKSCFTMNSMALQLLLSTNTDVLMAPLVAVAGQTLKDYSIRGES